jgi:hypothetical protein
MASERAPERAGGREPGRALPAHGTFRAAKLAVGLPTARAYDLRHSFGSLLIHEGQPGQREGLTGTRSGVGEDGHERRAAKPAVSEEVSPEMLDLGRDDGTDHDPPPGLRFKGGGLPQRASDTPPERGECSSHGERHSAWSEVRLARPFSDQAKAKAQDQRQPRALPRRRSPVKAVAA